jgi:hypothetical protein
MFVQATLDAFWLRASKAVANHVQEVRNMARYGQNLGYPPMPVIGPWGLHNHLRMDAAIIVFMHLMEKGKACGSMVLPERLALPLTYFGSLPH